MSLNVMIIMTTIVALMPTVLTLLEVMTAPVIVDSLEMALYVLVSLLVPHRRRCMYDKHMYLLFSYVGT